VRLLAEADELGAMFQSARAARSRSSTGTAARYRAAMAWLAQLIELGLA
jgi:hypothetical protein